MTLLTSIFGLDTGELAATVIDASGGPVAETLPAATGSGAVLLYANEDVSTTASLAPASGEQLNGVVDGSWLFSNFAAGSQFRADDIAPGQWVVSVVGPGSVSSTLAQGLWKMDGSTGNVTALPSTSIPFGSNLVEDFRDPDIAFNGTFWTLPAGRWNLQADLNDANANDAPRFQWHDGANLIGVAGNSAGTNSGFSGENVAEAVIESSSTITVSIRAVSSFTVTGTNAAVLSRVRIQQVAGPETVLAGMVAPGAAHRISFIGDWTTSGTTHQIGNADTIHDPNGLRVGHTIVIQNDGDYALDGFVDASSSYSNLDILVNSVKVSGFAGNSQTTADTHGIAISMILPSLAAGDVVSFGRPAGGTAYRGSIKLVQISSGTLILPDTVEFDDQTSSKSFDLGSTRVQRGYRQLAGPGATPTTVSFPLPFGSPPDVTCTLQWNYHATLNANLTDRGVIVEAPSTAGVQVRGVGDANALDGVSWHAIGPKP